MKTISEEEFKKKYGQQALDKFQEIDSVRFNSSQSANETRFGDAGEDIVTGAKGLVSDFKQRGETVLNASEAQNKGEQGILETGGQIAGQIIGGATDIVGRGISTLGKLFLKPNEEKAISETVQKGVEATGIPQVISKMSPRTQRNLEAGINLVELATIKGVSNVAKKQLSQADDILKKSIASNPIKGGVTLPSLSQKIKDVRFDLSNINPQIETALKRSDFDEVNKYFQQAKSASMDTKKATPLEIAGNKAEEAFNVIDEARQKAISGKKAILNEVANKRVSGNTLNDVMSTGIQKMNERFGVKITANGDIENVAGRVAQLDTVDQKLVSDYFTRLNKLGVSPTVKEVDDFIDWAQSQLYKQSKNLSTLESADKAVISNLKQITGDLNSRLKGQVGNGYGEVNARISNLIEMQDELSRALGADARKGGGLMKRLFSPTGGQTRNMFEQIRKETGIDLDKEANLARFAMDSVGDSRQKSLLQELDAGFQTAGELDLTKPVSIINFIRERADLDAQELANEIIKRAGEEAI